VHFVVGVLLYSLTHVYVPSLLSVFVGELRWRKSLLEIEKENFDLSDPHGKSIYGYDEDEARRGDYGDQDGDNAEDEEEEQSISKIEENRLKRLARAIHIFLFIYGEFLLSPVSEDCTPLLSSYVVDLLEGSLTLFCASIGRSCRSLFPDSLTAAKGFLLGKLLAHSCLYIRHFAN